MGAGSKRVVPTITVLACAAAAAVQSRAATDTWSAPAGDWSTATSWSLSHPPSSTDVAFLRNSGTAAVTLNLDTDANVAQFNIDALGAGPATFLQSANSFTAASEYIGSAHAGAVLLSGGTHTLTAADATGLFIGFGTAAAGALTINGGSLLLPAGNVAVGSSGTGTLNLSAGLLSVGGSGGLVVGDQASANGQVNHSGGSVITTALQIAPNGSGAYSMSNGATLTVGGVITIGGAGSGSFTQTGGQTTAGGGLFVGQFGPGSLTLSGGTLTVTNTSRVAATYVGTGALGVLTHDGGTLTTDVLEVGFLGNGFGLYALSGAASLVVNGNAIIGDIGSGSFAQTGGQASIAGGITVANGAGASGSWAISGGGSAQAGALTLGAAAGATGSLTVGDGATLDVLGDATVGDAGTGSFSQTGGAASLGSLTIANAVGAAGTMTLSSGSLDVNGSGTIGAGGSATFAQIGGTSVFHGTVSVAAQAGSAAALSVSGGALQADALTLGAGGTGTLSISAGGSVNVLGALTLTTSRAGTAIHLDGGSLTVGTLNLGGSLSPLHWSAGTLAITGDGGLLIDAAAPTGGAWTLADGQALAVTGTETIANGTFTQNGGSHTASLVAIGPAGTYGFNAGTINGPLSLAGRLNAVGGTLNGSLVVQPSGTATVSGSLAPSGGAVVYGNMTVALGATYGGGGLDVEGGVVTLAGGTIAPDGPALNNGSLSGFGTIAAGAGFTNNASLTQADGNLTLAGAGPQVNAATFTLAAGRQLILTTPLTNAGTLAINGAVVTGPATLNNGPLGTISGSGTIDAPLANTGTLLVQGGTLNVSRPFTNAGIIQLAGVGAGLNGAAVTSAGTIQGGGSIGAPVVNTGTIEPTGGGTLAFFAPLTNAPTGTLRAATGNKLLLSAGPATNAGTISLAGGTVDLNGAPLTNAGQITGYGTLATGGLLNASGATITLAGGAATVNGPLTNASAATLTVKDTPAIFTGPVVNDGSVIVSAASVTFAGGFTNNGLYASDPSTTFAADFNVGRSGALVGGVGDTFVTTGGLHSSSTQRAAWDTAQARLTFAAGRSATPHTITLTGSDLGPFAAGFDDNFAWGALELAAGESLLLEPFATGDGLYVHALQLDGVGSASLPSYIAAHLLNADATLPANVYYDANNPANAYLDDQTYALGNGGFLLPVSTPEPALLCLAPLVAAGLLRRRRRCEAI